MAEKHERMASAYRQKLLGQGFKLGGKAPTPEYRPDIIGRRGKTLLLVEVEIERTIQNDHTLEQLAIMHEFAHRKPRTKCILVVPHGCRSEAKFLIECVFGDKTIGVDTI